MEEIALEALEDSKEVAFDLNTEDQLFDRGVDSNDQSLGSYAPLSVTLRSEAGLPVDRITLKITGDFYDGWEADFSSFPIAFTSRDEKTSEILFQFTSDIFGLTKRNTEKLVDEEVTSRVQDISKKRVFNALSALR